MHDIFRIFGPLGMATEAQLGGGEVGGGQWQEVLERQIPLDRDMTSMSHTYFVPFNESWDALHIVRLWLIRFPRCGKAMLARAFLSCHYRRRRNDKNSLRQ